MLQSHTFKCGIIAGNVEIIPTQAEEIFTSDLVSQIVEQFFLDETAETWLNLIQKAFQLRISINTGNVVAGVIGMTKFTYDLWGDTVNIASRMESNGLPSKIQVSAATYDRLKEQFEFEKRGKITVKGKGEMMTYWLLGKARHFETFL